MHSMQPLSRRSFIGTVAAAAMAGRLKMEPEIYALVLGSVQDGGLPQTGCYTPRCDRGRISPRYVASIGLVEPDSERVYLVDATPDITRQMDLIAEPWFRKHAEQRHPFDGIFLTHAHIGHYLGLALLGREGLGMAATPCYCSASMAEFLAQNAPWRLLVEEGRLELHALEFDKWHRIDDALSVQVLPIPHRHEFSDTVAFVFRGPSRSLLYLPDIDQWNKWARPIETVVSSVDIALVDGSFYSATEVPGRRHEDIPHPLMVDTMDRLQQSVRSGHKVVFTHLNNTNVALDTDGNEAADLRNRGFDIAKEGMRFTL